MAGADGSGGAAVGPGQRPVRASEALSALTRTEFALVRARAPA